jgi:ABC-2 type transport system permease protein
MNKISVIIKREYVTRVRKKSFIIMTLLTPILMAALFVVPALVMTNQDKEFKKIAVIEDGSVPMFRNVIPDTKDAQFVYLTDVKFDDLKTSFEKAGYYGILFISQEIIKTPNAIQLISKKQPPIGLLDHIENSLEKDIERKLLLSYNIDNLEQILKDVRRKVSVQTRSIDDAGVEKQTSTGIAMALAYLGGFLMYMLVFMFGAQVMRGVIEEKVSRVVEVIISSVKPYQLMLGKIVGVALVGLTQFLVWIMLTLGIVLAIKTAMVPKDAIQQITQSMDVMNSNSPQTTVQTKPSELSTKFNFTPEFQQQFTSALNQPWGLFLICFVFYFITGYLLYASVFAAIGSAVDNETETQQFMLPVTIPIILGLFIAMGTMQNPESSISFWGSMIPLTSPIVMMARIPFMSPGQYWEIGVSMLIMVISFMAFVWMAAKIYRTGILMYGKKTSWKEMIKWLRYRG